MAITSARKLTLGILTFSITSNLAWAEPPAGILVGKHNSQSVMRKSTVVSEAPKRMLETHDAETVRERFKNGKVQVERSVVLDDEGNFVNHGTFTEWNEKGELVQTGNFKNGLRDGAWIKMSTASQSKLFDEAPYNKFKAPFQSTVEFKDGEMNGVWSITDANNRIVSHISVEKGLRHGHAVWNLPSGTSMYEADYENGILHGLFLEKDAAGKLTKQLDYDHGSVRQIERETFPNKRPKSEYSVLSGKAKLVSKDNFDKLMLASYAADGEPVKDGEFSLFHENGTVRSHGSYKRGEIDGNYEAWYASGERECIGSYENGKKVGKWTWWHSNGMRKSTGQYDQDHLLGEVLAWDEKGKRVNMTAKEVTVLPAKLTNGSVLLKR